MTTAVPSRHKINVSEVVTMRIKSFIKKSLKACLPYGVLCIWRTYNQQIRDSFNNKLAKKYHNAIDVPDNCVLLIEVFEFHGEVLPGLAKYILDLGYRVDVLMASSKGKVHGSRNGIDVFSRFESSLLRVFLFPAKYMIPFLSSTKMKQYKHIVINSYSEHIFRNIDLFKLKPVCMVHENDSMVNEYIKTKKIITLVRMDCFDRGQPAVVNAHYFGACIPHKKSRITEFIAFGNTDTVIRRNINLVTKICEYLDYKTITEYKIKIVGDNHFIIPDKYEKHIESLGFLSFSELYKEIDGVDFILTLIDPASVEYTNKASGTYQLSYGFLKPVLIHKKFAEVGNFNDKNSIIYENIYFSMEYAIRMSTEEYDMMVEQLRVAEQSLYKSSINNLKYAIEADVQKI